MGPFMRADEDLVFPMEVENSFEIKFMGISYIIIQVQYDGVYYLGFDTSSNAVDFCGVTWV